MARLIIISLLFLLSLLALFKAPAYYLWLAAVLVTEYPLVFAGLAAVITASGIWVAKYQLAGTIIGVTAFVLFLLPVAMACLVAKNLKKNLTEAFGDAGDTGAPFNFYKLITPTEKNGSYNTLTYVKYAGTGLTLDYYPSQIPGKMPCVIVVHGGSWSSGDAKQLPELNIQLAKAGYNVAAINYRMAPEYHNPAPVIDVAAALKYLRANNNALNVDTNKFVLLGRSAGAQIALLAAYTLHDRSLKGVIDFYGPADMVWGYSVPANPWVMDSRKVMEQYLGGSYNSVPKNYAASSPVQFVDKQTIPTLIIHGYNDVLVAYDHSRRLNEKLQQNGIKHYWLQLPWATHGFDYNLNGPGGQLSTYAVEHFLYTVTQ